MSNLPFAEIRLAQSQNSIWWRTSEGWLPTHLPIEWGGQERKRCSVRGQSHKNLWSLESRKFVFSGTDFYKIFLRFPHIFNWSPKIRRRSWRGEKGGATAARQGSHSFSRPWQQLLPSAMHNSGADISTVLRKFLSKLALVGLQSTYPFR